MKNTYQPWKKLSKIRIKIFNPREKNKLSLEMTDYGLHAFEIEGNSSFSKILSYGQLLMVYLRKWSGFSAFATANKMNTEVRNVIQTVREFNILRFLSKQLNSKSYCIGRKIKKIYLESISEWLIEM